MGDVVYLAIIEDRHTDVQVEVFLSEESAVKYAKEYAVSHSRSGQIEEQELNDTMRSNGWLYHAPFSCEGDYVMVQRKTASY